MTESIAPKARRRSADDRGFVLIMVGLLIIPIVAFTALAIDVSAWYSRATELQRSADAAALAGVVWMPRLTDAQTNATSTLVANGTPIGGNISATMIPGAKPNSFKVCLTDAKAPQFFSVVFSGPTSLTRCATAQYNLPLELGSPLNYYGGNATADFGSTTVSTGTQHPESSSTPINVDDPEQPNNYATAVASDGNLHGCKYDNWTYNGHDTGFWWDQNGVRAGTTDHKYYLDAAPAPVLWKTTNRWGQTRNHYPIDLPDCLFTHMVDDTTTVPNNPIPASKSPNFWAAIAGPGMFTNNGDAYAPRCWTSGQCAVPTPPATNPNTMYRPKGYFYALDVPSGTTSGNISVQIFDATQSQTSGTAPTGDTRYGGSSIQDTTFTLWNAGTTPYDMGDDTVVAGCQHTYGSSDPAYDKLWTQLCSFSPTVGQRYYLQVSSTNDYANTYNGYAIRAVAGSFPDACLAATLPQRNNVDCYGTDPQPRLSGYGDMEMYNGIPAGTPTQFFIANVLPEYAGRTLVIELWDPGDMSGGGSGDNSYITVMKPGSTTAGTAQRGCTWRAYGPPPAIPGTFTTIGSTSDCQVQSTSNGSNAYNGKWVQFKIALPDDYTCNKNANPVTTGGSCWWQILYNVTGSTRLNDYTTWTARIEGDPVRLTQ